MTLPVKLNGQLKVKWVMKGLTLRLQEILLERRNFSPVNAQAWISYSKRLPFERTKFCI